MTDSIWQNDSVRNELENVVATVTTDSKSLVEDGATRTFDIDSWDWRSDRRRRQNSPGHRLQGILNARYKAQLRRTIQEEVDASTTNKYGSQPDISENILSKESILAVSTDTMDVAMGGNWDSGPTLPLLMSEEEPSPLLTSALKSSSALLSINHTGDAAIVRHVNDFLGPWHSWQSEPVETILRWCGDMEAGGMAKIGIAAHHEALLEAQAQSNAAKEFVTA